MKRILCFLLCVVMFLSIIACADTGDQPLPTTDTYVVKNNVSPYKIVIPANASNQLLFAASDFQHFFKEATGVTLEIVNSVDNVKGKYFSIGETQIYEACGMTTDYEELGTDGYKVMTYGDAIVMAGNTDESSTYAVYGYLGKQFGLEIYGDDVYKITKTGNAKLLDINWTDIPDIPNRIGGAGYYSWYGTTEFMSRMRLRDMTVYWGLRGHSYFTILPPSQYIAEHPDWYDSTTSPLEICKTNDEMTAQFIANLKQIILDSPDAIYYSIGHEDGGPSCKCSDCQAVRNQYGGSNSALEVLFTNKVVRAINEWAAVEIPDRILKFSMFAYTTTEVPPVEYDKATNTYYPINNDEALMLEENLGIMIAPISSHSSSPYMDQSYANSVFNGWDALTDNFYIWAYSCPFGNYLVPFDAFGAYEQNYRYYVDIGAEWLFEQGFYNAPAPNFMELRNYLNSKLSWDSTLNTETLIRDFMQNYYGPGWEYIYKFLTLWRLRMTELQEYNMFSYSAAQLVQDYCQPSLYPKELIDQYEALFDAALLANESLKETDPEMYERYRDNIRAERCLVRYLSLSMYSAYYDAETYKAMIDEFASISATKGYTVYSNSTSHTVSSLLDKWTTYLNQK